MAFATFSLFAFEDRVIASGVKYSCWNRVPSGGVVHKKIAFVIKSDGEGIAVAELSQSFGQRE